MTGGHSLSDQWASYYCSARLGSQGPLRTLHISESIWPPPFSTGVCRNEEPSPEEQKDKEISLYQFILSLFEGWGSFSLEILQVYS